MAGRKLLSVEEKTEILNFKIDSSMARLFREILQKEGLSVSESLRAIVEQYVERKGWMVKHVSGKKSGGRGVQA